MSENFTGVPNKSVIRGVWVFDSNFKHFAFITIISAANSLDPHTSEHLITIDILYLIEHMDNQMIEVWLRDGLVVYSFKIFVQAVRVHTPKGRLI